MILHESDLEHRVIRQDKSGNKWEYSNKKGFPSGDGWTRVDKRKHPRARTYLWVRPYSFVIKSLRQDQRKPMIEQPTDLVSIDPRLAPSLDVEVGNVINEFRNQLRKQFEYEKNPFLTGDRIRIEGQDGIFYVRGVDPNTHRLVAVSATDKEKVVGVAYDKAKIDNERGPMPWYFGDRVKISAGALDKTEAEGEIIGYDNHTNKLRVQIGTESFEVFPESVIGVRGKSGEVLEKAEKHLIQNPSSFSSPHAKKVIESLLRASLEGRMQVGVREVVEDINATSGNLLTEGQVRGTFAALSSLFSGGKNDSIFYNPTLDRLHIEYGRLPIRLISNMREIKNTHKAFGWKNITNDDGQETYARVGQKIRMPPNTKDSDGTPVPDGRIRKIMGNRVEVAYGDRTKVMYMGDLTDMVGRKILPDPTDPTAFGEFNNQAFWLLRDREWVRDYKVGDVVSLSQMLQSTSGGKLGAGEMGKVIDTTTDGRLIVRTNKGTKLSVSPRQVRQNRQVADLWQLEDKVRHDPTAVYGTMTVVGKTPNEQVRVGVGGDRKHRFMEFSFGTGATYKNMEQELFTAIRDDRATFGQTRAIIPSDESVENRESKTLVPNKTLLGIIRNLYPTAETFMITRDLKRFPNEPTAIAGRAVPTEEGELEKAMRSRVLDTQPVRATKQAGEYQGDNFEPAHYTYDDESGEFRVNNKPMAQPIGVDKWNWASPFSKTPVNTRTYSPGEIDRMQRETPVSLRITINPTKDEMKQRYGVLHKVSTVARALSDSPQVPPKGASAVENLDWSKRVKISSDGRNMFISVGKELTDIASPKFRSITGEPMTLHQVVTMPVTHKYTAWQAAMGNDFAKLLLQSSVLSYDRTNKRYQARLSHYDEVHDFLNTFFGEDAYSGLVFEEDSDGAYCYSAEDRKLRGEALKYERSRQIAKTDTSPITDKGAMDGFAYKFMGYNGKGATPQNEVDWKSRDYQRETMNFMITNPKTLLANDQGTGKTGAILGAMMSRINRGEVKKALIIVPANLVSTSWPDEIRFWCRDQAMIDAIERNPSMNRAAKEAALRDIDPSINYELLTSRNKEGFFNSILRDSDEPVIGVASYEMALRHSQELQRAGFDMVVLDEAQNIKTGETAQRSGSQRAQALKDSFVDVPYKIAATGTPIENSAEDLHSIVTWLDPNLLGSAAQFMQDFIEVDYVDTQDGKRPVNVAVKNPIDLHERLSGVYKRYTKDFLRKRELEEIRSMKELLGEPFDPNIDYGAIAPMYRYPATTLTSEGKLVYIKPQRPSEFALDPDLSQPLDLRNSRALEDAHGVPSGTYSDYIRAVRTVEQYFASEFGGFRRMKSRRGGSMMVDATAMLTRLQQVINDPYIISSKIPALADNPLFRNPNMPNPKFDRLVKILDEHDRNTLHMDYKTLEYNPLNKKGNKENRRTALTTRGKTIIFCQNVDTMRSLQARLERNPKYRGRMAFYAGTGSIGELSGEKGGGKAQQRAIYNRFKHDPNVDILIANDAAQTGLSIPQADLVINYEMNWNPQAMNQRIDRAHRMGIGSSNQHRPVTAIDLITLGSVEEKKARSHAFRRQLFDVVLNPQETQSLSAEEQKRVALVNLERAGARQGAATLQGDNSAAIMDELIQENPEMRRVMAMSEPYIARMNQAKKVARAEAKVRKARPRIKPGILSRILFGR